MSDSSSLPPISADSSRRKLIAIGVASSLVLIMAYAFMSGGKKPATHKDTEKDPAIGELQDGADNRFNGGSGDVIENWPDATEGTVVAQNSTTESPTPSDQKISSVVTGDDPSANPPATTPGAPGNNEIAINTPSAQPANSKASPAPVANEPQMQPKTQGGGTEVAPAETSRPARDGSSSIAGKTDATPAISVAPSTASIARGESPSGNGTTAAAAPTTAPSNKTPPGAKTDSNPANVASTQTGPASPADETAPIASAPSGNGKSKAKMKAGASSAPPASSDNPREAKAPANTPAAVASAKPQAVKGTPSFARATIRRPGLIAQSRTLVTEEEFSAPRKASESAPLPAPVKAKPAPARVKHTEARAYAEQTTEHLRQNGTLRPGESVRLPRRTEAANPKIWRDDDSPTNSEERRPFGLVVVNEKAAFTPEGIPLRTDIPAGASPLEKAGADKPLWKRPE